jgi:prepilin-type processing-associated H-X9-DG protein
MPSKAYLELNMPKGNPFWCGKACGMPACSDTNSLAGGTACTLLSTTYVPGNYVIGHSDYVAVTGLYIDASHTNPLFTPALAAKYRSLFNYPVTTSLAHVPDGVGNTLLFSEFCGSYLTGQATQPSLNGWCSASWTTNGITVAYGTCPDPNNRTDVGGLCDFSQDGGYGLGSGGTLGGWHNGRFHVAFADGSVRTLKVGLSKQLLYSLAGYKDGDVIPPFD